MKIKKILVLDKFLTFLALGLFGVFRPDYVVIGSYLFLIPYLFLTKRKNVLKHMLLATIISAVWVLFTKDLYVYSYDFVRFYGVSLYPFFGWSAGLVGTYLIFGHYRDKLENKNFIKQILVFLPIYWALLLFGETVAYYVFDVRNILTTIGNSPLPICNCMHIPNWMKVAYFSLGPLFFGVSYLLGWEKDSKIKDNRQKPKAF